MMTIGIDVGIWLLLGIILIGIIGLYKLSRPIGPSWKSEKEGYFN